MKNIISVLSVLSVLLLEVISINVIKPKLCLNCKYLITENGKKGNWSLFRKEENNNYMLVNCISESIENRNCFTVKKFEDMCDKECEMHKRCKNSNKKNILIKICLCVICFFLLICFFVFLYICFFLIFFFFFKRPFLYLL